MKAKAWLIGWLVLVSILLTVIGGTVYKIDPYFHFHKPDTNQYYYKIDDQRNQNDGISKHFEYNALITGTSMIENFKTTEFDEIFGVDSIKVPYSGGTYKEINDNIQVALENNPNLKTIVRCLDYGKIMDDKDAMRTDMGTYPTYLYDNNPFNDVKYLFIKDVIFNRSYRMILDNNEEGFDPGITSFDDYSRWQYSYTFGTNTVIPDGISIAEPSEIHVLTDEYKERIRGNIVQNVTSLADEYPEVEFYYFFSPYSVVWWNELIGKGDFYRWIDAEKYAIELILGHDNIHLYSFNNCTDITTDLNNYKDASHYGQWINSLMLRWIKDGKYLLNESNYLDYIEEEKKIYSSFDYLSLDRQSDYENDFYAAALWNKEFKGVTPINILDNSSFQIDLSGAEVVGEQFEGKQGIRCVGSLQRDPDDEICVEEYLLNKQYIGAKINISDLNDRDYLVFYGQKISDNGQPTVYVYDGEGNKIADVAKAYQDIDYEWHQYVIDLSKVEGNIVIVFNGGYLDNTGSEDSNYIFSNIQLY